MSFSQAIYDEAIAGGASPLFADMLAHRQPPGTKGTDQRFLSGRYNNNDLEDMPPWMQKQFKKQLDRAGVSAAGKVYLSSLARKKSEVKPGEPWGPGDPYAYVSDLAEAKAKCLALGRYGSGMATVTPPEKPPAPDVPLAEDLVMTKVAEAIAKDPSKAKRLDEVRHEVIEKHAPKWGKGATKNFLKKARLKK